MVPWDIVFYYNLYVPFYYNVFEELKCSSADNETHLLIPNKLYIFLLFFQTNSFQIFT